ncbi:MAG: type VI secretion system tube protein Hcp [Gammaproteobacteria bacterium]|nr:type VI secretion system tube protein Hcp [Gammaproteobacteria bacterium]
MAIAAMYLKMTGVTGESLADGHVGDIDLVSWDWGVLSAAHTLSDGSPGGASSFQALNLIKRVDRATPALFSLCDTHKVISSATLTVSKASGGSPLEYVTIDMTNVRIIKVDVRSEEAELKEHVTLSCETVTFNYKPQASGGAQASGPISFTAVHPATH